MIFYKYWILTLDISACSACSRWSCRWLCSDLQSIDWKATLLALQSAPIWSNPFWRWWKMLKDVERCWKMLKIKKAMPNSTDFDHDSSIFIVYGEHQPYIWPISRATSFSETSSFQSIGVRTWNARQMWNLRCGKSAWSTDGKWSDMVRFISWRASWRATRWRSIQKYPYDHPLRSLSGGLRDSDSVSETNSDFQVTSVALDPFGSASEVMACDWPQLRCSLTTSALRNASCATRPAQRVLREAETECYWSSMCGCVIASKRLRLATAGYGVQCLFFLGNHWYTYIIIYNHI